MNNRMILLAFSAVLTLAPSPARAAPSRDRAQAERWYTEGERLRAEGDSVRALDAYDRSIRIDPRHYDSRLARSRLNAGRRRYDLAAADLVPLIATGAAAVGPETPEQQTALRGVPQASIILAASYLRRHCEEFCRHLLYQGLGDSAAAAAGRFGDIFPESFYLAVVPGHAALLAGDTLAARSSYRAALSLLTAMEELLNGPLSDFDAFVQAGLRPQAAAAASDWLAEQFRADGRHYLTAVRHFAKAAELADQKEYLDAPPHIDKAVAAELGAAHPRYEFLAQITGLAGDLHGQARQYPQALRYYERSLEFARLSGSRQAVSIQLDKLAAVLKVTGAYGRALDHYQQALAIDRELGDRENIAADLRKIGKVYYSWGKYPEALAHHRQALAIDRELGNDQGLSDDLNEIGVVHHAQAQYDSAIGHYRQVLEIGRRMGAEELVAVCLNNIGMVYNDWGRYDQAVSHFQQALELNHRMGNEDNMAVALNNIGLVHDARGRYDRALAFYEQALAIDRRLEKTADMAVRLNNIGRVYDAWGKHDRAVEYYRQALEIDRSLGKEALIPTYLSNIGRVYRASGRHELAVEHYRQALEIDRRLGQDGNIGKDLVNIGSVYFDAGAYDRAIEYFESARQADLRLGRESNVAQDLGHIGRVYLAWGRFDQARSQFLRSLAIQQRLGEDPAAASTLGDLGRTAYARGKYAEAGKHFERSIELIEKIRLTASGDVRRDYLATQLAAYQWLALTGHSAGKPAEALRAVEQSRSKYLVEQLGERLGGGSTAFRGIKQWQRTLGSGTAVICYSGIELDRPLAVVMTSSGIRSVLLDKAAADSAIDRSCGAAIRNALDTLEAVTEQAAAKAGDGVDLSGHARERENFERVVNFYRYLLTRPRLKGRNLENFQIASRALYDFLLAPLEKDLAGRDDLIILPDGILGFVPFETMLRPDSRYLAQEYSIRYAQSLTVADIIGTRRYDANREPLIAFGGAVYQAASYPGEMAAADAEYRRLQADEQTNRGPSEERSSGWRNLPGTKVEVMMIKDIMDQAVVFTGADVEESRIKQLSADGGLRDYKVVHFATHGLVDLARPELSAVVLSQFDQPHAGEDGYLRVPEVAGLELRADLVNLSACETGLGKIYGGEGVVGLTQAFLLAGANGLSVSLWQVSDQSTMRFMVGVYRLVKEQGLPYHRAIAEVKRRFISGAIAGENWHNPYFWAPFVYYGR